MKPVMPLVLENSINDLSKTGLLLDKHYEEEKTIYLFAEFLEAEHEDSYIRVVLQDTIVGDSSEYLKRALSPEYLVQLLKENDPMTAPNFYPYGYANDKAAGEIHFVTSNVMNQLQETFVVDYQSLEQSLSMLLKFQVLAVEEG
ncbi:hypothetical protein [Savagea faecisuis]|uniref:Uncharacterized protein n=1 Tax=Savagea faecisuis TaxID=1274803 RepID=A0ABW3GU45_9BACL